MKRLLLTATAVVAILLAGAASVNAEPPDKVTICHAAGLADEPANWVELTLPWVAVYGQAGHFNENGTPQAGHEQDYLGPCVAEETPAPETPAPTVAPPTEAPPTVEPSEPPTTGGTPEPIPTPPATSTAADEGAGNAMGLLIATIIIALASLWINPLIRKVNKF